MIIKILEVTIIWSVWGDV